MAGTHLDVLLRAARNALKSEGLRGDKEAVLKLIDEHERLTVTVVRKPL